ncbi:helix-turn-helix domain-containing protein [Pseudonocardia sp. RS010]|uniref:helix-turn-helix domain-containing protein n=1 Tax=Pseudonocardia sp. RS010 TaxID=3385979 RepID=UPI0039A3B405
MARQPEVFVRELTPDEAQRLVKITRTARDRVRLRRAGIVLASMQGRTATEAAAMFAAKPQYAREVIHAFNDKGFAALDPKWSGGRPRKFGPHVHEVICRAARTPPQQAGLPFTTWSLTKLVDHLATTHRIVVSTETVRQVLREAGVRWQTNASWLNWIESEFTALRYFTLDGSDYPSHAAQEAAIAGYVRWANRHARPKRHFAPESKIRRPDYLPNVA